MDNEMSRGLKTRHISMIAIGGSIGTGLFMASGAVISQAGPGGALLAYAVIGVMVYFLMTALGELATFYPVSGSFSAYANRFVDPAAGFSIGWIYWTIFSLVTSVDILTASKVLAYWEVLGGIHSFIWCLIFLSLLFLLNVFSVKSYGEAEYWFSFVKVATIILFLIVGILMIFGILGTGEVLGFTNFTYRDAPFVNGIAGFLGVLVVAGFSFGGTEVVAVTAGESENPKQSMPKAIKQIFWRILIFYIGSIFVISLIIPYTDPRLLNENSNIAMSPFTIVFEKAGILFAASIMNAVILTAVLSAGNSGMYATSRLLHSLSIDGSAPKFLSKLTKNNIPMNAMLTTIALVILSLIYAHINMGGYAKLLNMLGTLILLVWALCVLSHYRLRRAIIVQSEDEDELLTYKSPLYPIGAFIVFGTVMFLLIGQSYNDIVSLNWPKLIDSIVPVLICFTLYFGYKIKNKTKIIPLKDIDLTKHELN